MALTQSVKDSLKRLKDIANGGNGVDESPETSADIANLFKNMSMTDYQTLAKAGFDGVSNKDVNDRTYLMESVIQLVADIPPKTYLSNTLTHKFMNQLWTDIQHPPQSYLGKEYEYRKADGSNNNFLWPHVGQANQPYARTIKPSKMRPIARPDPGVVFDCILKRKEWQPHPNKISSVLFYTASIIIHDCFHTSHADFNISKTSSYLDLAPLYGSDEEQQERMRDKKRGGGRLKPDCFSDQRILGFPPGVGLLLIFFNRFHNDVVDKLAQIDENGRFSRIRNPPAHRPDYDGEKEYDNALFQTGRLITCGLYINIVLQDYVRTILNLNRTNSKWNLDPRAEQGKALFGEKIPVATGNQCSAEFNLVYRWHSCVSQRDEKWSRESAKKMFGVDPVGKDIPLDKILRSLQDWSYKTPTDPLERDFEGLKRDPTTDRFSDDALAQIWAESVEDVAGAYGANHVPEVLKVVEVLGINQARMWNLGSLNEFRKYFKLEPHKTFQSINPDPYVQEQLKRLYGEPDNVEIYPGIIVEAAKKPMAPGSGLCTNFTTSRAILSDAVALVRGDRFYTVDYTPQNLTNYGFNAANYDVNVNDGGVFYKLVLNALPNHFSKNSIYVHYPLTVPSENKEIMKSRGIERLYDYKRPIKQSVPKVVKSFKACEAIFKNGAATTSMAAIAPSSIVIGQKSNQGNGQASAQTLAALRKYLSTTPNKKYITKFFENITVDLLQKYSYTLGGVEAKDILHEVDIIQDVSNLAQVHFVACLFALPLKTSSNPGGAYEAEDLWTILTGLYSTLHTFSSPAASFRAQLAAQGVADDLGKRLVENIQSAHPERHGMIERIIESFHQHSSDLTDQSAHLIQEMNKTGVKPEDLAYNYLLPIAATIVVSQARAFADCLTCILPAEGTHPAFATVKKLAGLHTEEADAQIERIVLEALRVNSKTNIYVTLSSGVQVQEGGAPVTLSANETVLCDVYAANNDETAFKEATKFNASRADAYLPGLPSLPPMFPGQELGRSALVGMLKAVARMSNVKRAKGPVGQMRVITAKDGSKVYLTPDESSHYLYPSSMKLHFDR